MVQYILNTSAIWLISLVLFDVFLRRDILHAYNRFYLLFTFLVGVFLPLLRWSGTPRQTFSSLQFIEFTGTQPADVHQNIAATEVNATAFDWIHLLATVYIVGVVVTAVLLAMEIIGLVRFYRKGRKSVRNGCTIIETFTDHAPFSFFNMLFVGSVKQYSADEWSMIVIHERRHYVLYHIADVAIMQVARMVFWFHPLVYIYNKRLRMIHEYQADQASRALPDIYGRFLVQQALLHASPSFTHSFNRSPIKNRIMMLSKNSTPRPQWAGLKMILVVPLTLVSLFYFTQSGYSTDRIKKGNKVVFRGNEFTFSENMDTVNVKFTAAGAHSGPMMLRRKPFPIKENNDQIYEDKEVTTKPEFPGGIDKQLNLLAAELSKFSLPDDDYYFFVSNIVIDKTGKIVYYDPNGLMTYVDDPKSFFGKKQNVHKDPEMVAALEKLMDNFPRFEPATLDGKPVVSRWGSTLMLPSGKKIAVHNGQVSIVNTER